jgi:hypothetical protein
MIGLCSKGLHTAFTTSSSDARELLCFVGAFAGAWLAIRIGNEWLRRIFLTAAWVLGLKALLFDVLGASIRGDVPALRHEGLDGPPLQPPTSQSNPSGVVRRTISGLPYIAGMFSCKLLAMIPSVAEL